MISFERRSVRRAGIGLLGATAPFITSAQDRPARILVGFPAGGSFDVIARVLADKMKTELGRPVLVENRPGAGSKIAAEILKGSPRDGSVVLLAPDAITAIYPHTTRKLNYDPQKDLTPIATISEFPFAICSGVDPKVGTLTEYIAWAKANPNRFSIGIPAAGAPHHFFSLMLADSMRLKLEPAVFQGSAPIYTALLGGHISAAIDGMTSMVEYHKAGRLRILAVAADRRMPQVPEVPTFAEQGYPDLSVMGYNALYAPGGTPASVVDTWSRALTNALAQPDVRERFATMGFFPVGKGPEELVARSQKSASTWEPVIRKSGFTVD